MIRTQIYITENEKKILSILSTRFGKKQSELIREAIDNFIAKFSKKKSGDIFDKVSGMWKDRDDIPEMESLRSTWDRKFEL